MIQIENSFFALAEASERNCLVICDRGTMDASAFVSKQEWDEILQRNMCDEVDIRDNRYHQVAGERIFFMTFQTVSQVVHMVTSAKGAEQYYTIGRQLFLVQIFINSKFCSSQNTTQPDWKAWRRLEKETQRPLRPGLVSRSQ